jgi:uncharacterized membrane protein
MENIHLIYAGMLGLGLAASCGLNTFLPLLMLAGAAHFHLFNVQLNGSFAWLASDAALLALGIAAVVEIIDDKIPAVDHGLDVIGTFARPAAGTVGAAAVFHGIDPTYAALIGLIIGAPLSFGFHSAKAGTRAASSATTFGIGNPVLSLLEDIFAVGLMLISLILPLLVPVVLLITIWLLWKMVKAVRARLPQRRAVPPTS